MKRGSAWPQKLHLECGSHRALVCLLPCLPLVFAQPGCP